MRFHTRPGSIVVPSLAAVEDGRAWHFPADLLRLL
jgi:hypothetical protein